MARKRGAAALFIAAGLMLSGCMEGGLGLFSGGDGMSGEHAPSSTQVMSQGIIVAGPKGFCIDDSATREDEEGAFVLLGSCSAISGNPRDAKPRRPAVLTASVAPAAQPLDEGTLDRMAAFFSTEAGRAGLSRADGGTPVEVLDLGREDGLLLVHASDGASEGNIAGDYWRGVFGLAGQLVTVTVSGFQEKPLDDRTGQALARDFVQAIRTANGAAPDPAEAPIAGGLAEFLNHLL